jgi:WD repeat and SOF domain-containing protein 1
MVLFPRSRGLALSGLSDALKPSKSSPHRSCMFSSNSRQNGFRDLTRSPNGLPVFTSAIREKKIRHTKTSPWTFSIFFPIPGFRNRHFRIILPNLSIFHRVSLSHSSRRRSTLVLLFACVSITFIIFAIAQRFRTEEKQWSAPLFQGEPPTLVFGREDLQNIWKWEVQSGHYPSRRDSRCWPRDLRPSAYSCSFSPETSRPDCSSP